MRNQKNAKSRRYKSGNRMNDAVKKDGNNKYSNERVGSKFNDPSWYTRDPQLLKDTASLSFNRALGSKSTLEAAGNAINLGSYAFSVPGIMAIATIPAVGFSANPSSAINIAAKNYYSFIRHANSGHSNYDSPDLMLYLMAMDSIYSYIAFLQRIYGVAHTYSQVNRYVGDGFMQAMRVDPNSIRSNLADFRAYINMLITKASAFVVPSDMPIFLRHMWMYSGIYKDEDGSKAQTYMYVPMGVFKYVENAGTPGYLTMRNIIGNPTLVNGEWTMYNTITYGDLRTFGDDLISALVASEDFAIMSGDILKAHGDAVWRMGLIPEDYTCVPVYSEEVLDQIHNTTFVGSYPVSGSSVSTLSPSLASLAITQDATSNDPHLIYMPRFKGALETGYSRFLDMDDESPSPDRVIVATRNMVCGTLRHHNDDVYSYLDNFGSDICLFGYILTLGSDGLFGVTKYHTSYLTETFSDTKYFHRAPLDYIFTPFVETGEFPNLMNVVGELNNYTIVNKNDLDMMHQSAMLSLFGVGK